MQQRLDYDQLNRPCIHYGANGNPQRFSYDLLGRLQQEADAAGNITRYEYTTDRHNPCGSLSRLIYPDRSEIKLRYDPCFEQFQHWIESG